MTYYEYVLATRRTWNFKNDKKFQLANAALGLSEIHELILEVGGLFSISAEGESLENTEKIIDELGDLMYYLTRLLDILIEFDEEDVNFQITPTELAQDGLVETIGAIFTLQEIIKKIAFHDKSNDWIVENIRKIFENCVTVYTFGVNIAQLVNVDLEMVLQKNIEKLSNRHPVGFSGDYNSTSG